MTDDGSTLWAWQVQEPEGNWSMVGTMIGNMHSPLIHRKRDVAMLMAGLAKSHAKTTGQPLRLAEFELKNQWREN